MQLEHAIEEPGTSDDPHPALQAILTVFRKNLRNPETRTTAKDWIQVWVKETLASKEKVSPTREILRWSTNKVAEAEDGFFGLHWRDKVRVVDARVTSQWLTHSSSASSAPDYDRPPTHQHAIHQGAHPDVLRHRTRSTWKSAYHRRKSSHRRVSRHRQRPEEVVADRWCVSALLVPGVPVN